MKTALAEHVENDPLYKCKDYDENNSFNHCIDKELEVGKKLCVILSSIFSGRIPSASRLRSFVVCQ